MRLFSLLPPLGVRRAQWCARRASGIPVNRPAPTCSTTSCGPPSRRSRIERLRHSLQERCICLQHGRLREDGGAGAHENALRAQPCLSPPERQPGPSRPSACCFARDITLTSDSGKSATLAVVIRRCGLCFRHFSCCQGRYRCIGDACLTRRGRLFNEVSFGTIDLTPKGRRNLSCTLSFDTFEGFSSGGVYSCWRTLRRSRSLVDSGRFDST